MFTIKLNNNEQDKWAKLRLGFLQEILSSYLFNVKSTCPWPYKNPLQSAHIKIIELWYNHV